MENSKKKTIIQCSAFALFLITSIVMFFFHEPWYDEIQAWMVASDASLKEMLFTLPHYEGHPPLWHLFLAVFAKSGVPMEIGLRIPALLFSGAAVWVIVFKAPFQLWARVLIPFTYFLFYQYTVINRPYSILMLGFVLAAWFYKERNQKPVRYIAALYVMCLSCAFGMLFAACFCVIWTVEIIWELKGKEFVQKALKDRRTWCLVTILLLAVSLYAIISPADNAFAQVRVVEFSKLKCLIYMFLIAPGDALVTDISLTGRLQQQIDGIVYTSYGVFICIFVSILISVVLVIFTKAYKKMHLLVFPYCLFGFFGAVVYFYNHHIGIIALFVLFVLWCCLADPPEEKKIPKWLVKLEASSPKLTTKMSNFFLGLCIVMAVGWTLIACKNDIQLQTWYAKELAEFMNEYDMDQYRIATQWTYAKIDGDESFESQTYQAKDYYQYVKMCNFVDILAYTEGNYIYNFNGGNPNNRYINHDMLSQEESLVYLEQLGQQGYPEIIIGNTGIVGMMGLDMQEHTYKPVYTFVCYRINKYNKMYAAECVYAREDIYNSRDDWPIFEQIRDGIQLLQESGIQMESGELSQ